MDTKTFMKARNRMPDKAKKVKSVACKTAQALEFPGIQPGKAMSKTTADSFVLANKVIECAWRISGGRLKPVQVTDKLNGENLQLQESECFQIILSKSPFMELRTINASDMKLIGKPQLKKIRPSIQATNLAERFAGIEITIRLVSPDGNLEVTWQAMLRDSSNYIRQKITMTAKSEPAELKEIVLLNIKAPEARVLGNVDGSPAVCGNMFFASEHPMSKSLITESGSATRLRCSQPHNVAIEPEAQISYSAIIGVVPQGQLRRGFLYYLERERAQPYRQLLHHNNGEDVGMPYWLTYKTPNKLEEARKHRLSQEHAWINVIEEIGTELVKNRGVAMDSFVHDWGWDEEDVPWQFNEGYPNGFTPAERIAKKYNTPIGVWFSPMGGYDDKVHKVKSGSEHGFEVNQQGLSLAGPRYFTRFRASCVNMVRRYDLNYFKFDGFGAGNDATGPGVFSSDVEALLRVLCDIRKARPDVFLNATTGVWPSPFWLLKADSIWRSGSDTGNFGKGSERQKWISYRDYHIYHSVLGRSPLCPVNSLMLHGIMVNKFGRVKTYDTGDIIDEIRSFFGTGTNLQELYILPELMTPATWDALAEAANWARNNSDVLVDTHWIGGDPGNYEVYGWASWSKRKGIITLRNPDDQPAEITLDIGKAFELTPGAASRFILNSPWKNDAGKKEIAVVAGVDFEFLLKPFEVLVFDAVPMKKK